MTWLLSTVLQVVALVAMYWQGRYAERGKVLRRAIELLEARHDEYVASDRSPEAVWTFAGYLRAFTELVPASAPRPQEGPVEDRPEWGAR